MTTEIDTNEIVMKLSFLIGKTILLKAKDGSSCATSIESIRVGDKPAPMVDIHYSGLGVQHLTSSKVFNDIMLVMENGGLQPLGKITDNLGIIF